MRFGTRVAFKSIIAARAAALLAWAAADKGDRVGGLVFDESRRFERRPVARTRGLLPLLKALSVDPVPGEGGGHSSLSAAAQQLIHLVRPGSLVFLLSDFAGLSRDDGAWLARLGAGSELVLVQIFDPLEAAARHGWHQTGHVGHSLGGAARGLVPALFGTCLSIGGSQPASPCPPDQPAYRPTGG
jgi:uncharacterized protein (DUF58 family)